MAENTQNDTAVNKVKAARVGAQAFLTLRAEVVAVLVERLSIADGGYEIAGHDETAERIILLFADLLAEAAQHNEESQHVG